MNNNSHFRTSLVPSRPAGGTRLEHRKPAVLMPCLQDLSSEACDVAASHSRLSPARNPHTLQRRNPAAAAAAAYNYIRNILHPLRCDETDTARAG